MAQWTGFTIVNPPRSHLEQLNEKQREFAALEEKFRTVARDHAQLERLLEEAEESKGQISNALDDALIEVERLRALIKGAEWQAGYSGWCPWCQCDNGQPHHEKSATCSGDCPAFTPEGVVK